MGGEIWVKSRPAEGSTFSFTVESEPAEVEATRPERLSPLALRDRQVLVVDDNETNREIVEHYLEAWDADPVPFADPLEALAWIEEGNEPDLALLDYQMPQMDGLELAKRIQAIRPADEMPIVLITSMMRDEKAVRDANVELAAYLTKPIKPSQFHDDLLSILGEETDRDLEEIDREQRIFDPEMAARLPLAILVVEDNPVSKKVATRMLEKLGYDPDTVSDGPEAIQAVQTVDYDLVLMDVQIPDMTGYEATQRIREALDEERQPRIVALTAHASAEAQQQAKESKMDDYITKPLSGETLVAALERTVPDETDD